MVIEYVIMKDFEFTEKFLKIHTQSLYTSHISLLIYIFTRFIVTRMDL